MCVCDDSWCVSRIHILKLVVKLDLVSCLNLLWSNFCPVLPMSSNYRRHLVMEEKQEKLMGLDFLITRLFGRPAVLEVSASRILFFNGNRNPSVEMDDRPGHTVENERNGEGDRPGWVHFVVPPHSGG